MTVPGYRHCPSSGGAFQCQLVLCSPARGGISDTWSPLLQDNDKTVKISHCQCSMPHHSCTSFPPYHTWHVQMYFPRLFSETTTSRLEWCCLVCLSGGCSQLQGLGDSWTHGNRRCRPRETRISLMEGLQRPGDCKGVLKRKTFHLRWDPTNEMNSPSPMAHFLKASSTMSRDPGLESQTKYTKPLH